MAQAPGDFRERSLSAQDGLRLYYRDYGDPLSRATPVVCLAGLTRNSKDFHGLAGRLSARRRVVCPDYRGRGRSARDSDWRNYAPPVILGDVVQLLAANNLHRVVVCGVSFGGLLAMGLAVAAPTALAGVILDDVGPKVEPAAGKRILDYVSRDRPQPDWAAAVTEIKTRFPDLSYTTEAGWRGFAEATYRTGADGRLHFDWDVALAKPLMAGGNGAGRNGADGNGAGDHWPLYRALAHLPVLAIRGGRSDVLSEATFARMAAEKPDLVQLTLPRVGHAPTLEEPESEHAIDEFLARIDG